MRYRRRRSEVSEKMVICNGPYFKKEIRKENKKKIKIENLLEIWRPYGVGFYESSNRGLGYYIKRREGLASDFRFPGCTPITTDPSDPSSLFFFSFLPPLSYLSISSFTTATV